MLKTIGPNPDPCGMPVVEGFRKLFSFDMFTLP